MKKLSDSEIVTLRRMISRYENRGNRFVGESESYGIELVDDDDNTIEDDQYFEGDAEDLEAPPDYTEELIGIRDTLRNIDRSIETLTHFLTSKQ